jgi:hypothetical protein
MGQEDWQPATSRPGELYTVEGQSRARWVFLKGLRNREPDRNRYRSSMYRLGLVFIGVGLAAALLVGIVVAILQ